MTRTTVNAARDAALRFLDRANELLAADRDDGEYSFLPSVKSGALRRASMDLTRDLAAMRRPS